MIEDQARIIETRDASSQHHAVDVIVMVDPQVPPAVYLDETYTYRVRFPRRFFSPYMLTFYP